MKKIVTIFLLLCFLIVESQALMPGYKTKQLISIVSTYLTKKKTLAQQNVPHNLKIGYQQFKENPEDYNNVFYKVKDYVFYSIVYSNKYTRNLAYFKDLISENETVKKEYSNTEASKEKQLISNFNEEYNEAVNEFIKNGYKGEGKIKLFKSLKNLYTGLKSKLNGNINTIYSSNNQSNTQPSNINMNKTTSKSEENIDIKQLSQDEEVWGNINTLKIGYIYDKFIERFPNSKYIENAREFSNQYKYNNGILGSWKTNWNDMIFEYDNETGMFIGVYKNGNVIGYMEDNIFTGYWVENTGDNSCNELIMESQYWGNIVIDFSDNKEFKGNWSYCDNNVSKKQILNGKKIN